MCGMDASCFEGFYFQGQDNGVCDLAEFVLLHFAVCTEYSASEHYFLLSLVVDLKI